MRTRPEGFLSEDNIFHGGETFDYIKELHDYLWRFVRVAFPGTSGNLGNLVDDAIELLESAHGPTLVVTMRDGMLQHVIANERNIRFIPITDGIPAPTETAEYDPTYVRQTATSRVLITSCSVKEISNWILSGESVLDVITRSAWTLVKAAGASKGCHVQVLLEGNRFYAYLVQD